MIMDIVKVNIFDEEVKIEHIGLCQVNDEQVYLEDKNTWVSFDDGYVQNTKEDICKYLLKVREKYKYDVYCLEKRVAMIDFEMIMQTNRR